MESTPTKAGDAASVSAYVNSLPVTVNDIHISGNERTYNDFIERELQPLRDATTAGQLARNAYQAVSVSFPHHIRPATPLCAVRVPAVYQLLIVLLSDRYAIDCYRTSSRTASSRR